MHSKTKLGAVAGAVALALSAHAFANTTNAAGGTIWLSIDDQTAKTDYVFDTGLNSQTFAGTSSLAGISIANSNFTSFLASVAGGNLATTTDNVTFSVIGSSTAKVGTNTTQTRFVDFGSTSAPAGAGTNGATIGTNVTAAYGQIGTFLSTLANPSGGSTFVPNTVISSQWFQGGNSANFDSDLTISNGAAVSGSLAFYQETVLLPASATVNGAVSSFAGKWSLDLANSALDYTVSSSPVPLPAPLLLLLSGLGAMGIVGRRKTAAA